MRRNVKTKIIKRTASILTATIILVSGGYTAVANMFGFSKGSNKNQMMNKTNDTKPISSVNTTKETEIESKYQYKYKPEEKYLRDGIETTEAITQEENINRLIRKKRKEKANI